MGDGRGGITRGGCSWFWVLVLGVYFVRVRMMIGPGLLIYLIPFAI